MKEYLYTHYLEAIRSVLENSPKIDRKFMPQVSKDDLPEAIELLKKNGVQVTFKNILPTQLSSSQKQVNREKVINIVKDIKKGKKMPPLIVSIDGFIVDGHHRWLAYKLINPNQPIKVIQMNLPKDKAIIEYKKIENSI